jgi:hypothetical protein
MTTSELAEAIIEIELKALEDVEINSDIEDKIKERSEALAEAIAKFVQESGS